MDLVKINEETINILWKEIFLYMKEISDVGKEYQCIESKKICEKIKINASKSKKLLVLQRSQCYAKVKFCRSKY